jgi:hypothetical protein
MIYAAVVNGTIQNIVQIDNPDVVAALGASFQFFTRIDALNPMPAIGWTTSNGANFTAPQAVIQASSLANAGIDNSTIILDANNNIKLNPNVPLGTAPPLAIINGTAGTISWCMPVQTGSWKRVVILLAGYTALGPAPISFPIAFTKPPIAVSNTTGLSLSILTVNGITIPLATLASGIIVIEGV